MPGSSAISIGVRQRVSPKKAQLKKDAFLILFVRISNEYKLVCGLKEWSLNYE
jgi:hypothetical protein